MGAFNNARTTLVTARRTIARYALKFAWIAAKAKTPQILLQYAGHPITTPAQSGVLVVGFHQNRILQLGQSQCEILQKL